MSDQDYGRKEWRVDEPAAMAEAARRIRQAAETGADTLDFCDLAAIERLPEELDMVPGLKRLFAGLRRPDGAGPNSYFDTRMLRDVSALRHLRALTELDLEQTRVADATTIAELKTLVHLSLDRTQVTDLTPLAGLTSLATLSLNATHITDLAPLADLGALNVLYLFDTAVTDLTPLKQLMALSVLHLDYSKIDSIAPLSDLVGLTSLSFSNTAVSDAAPLTGLKALTKLWLDGTRISDFRPIFGLKDLDHIALDSTALPDLGFLLDLPKFAAEEGRYLQYRYTPAVNSDRRLDLLSRLPPDRCAIETVQYLKGTHPDFREPPAGAGKRGIAARIVDSAGLGLEMVAGRPELVNAPAPERLAPKERETRLQALRLHVADMCDDAAGCNLPQVYTRQFQRYAEALAAEEPTYLLLDGPMARLRGAAHDPYVTEALDAGFVAGWRDWIRQHDELRPLLLPPEDLDALPPVKPDVTPADAKNLADQVIEALEPAVAAGEVGGSVIEGVAAAREYFEVAAENTQRRPALLKRGLVAIGGILGSLSGLVGASGRLADAAMKVQNWIATPQGQAVVAALRPIWDLLVTFFKGG